MTDTVALVASIIDRAIVAVVARNIVERVCAAARRRARVSRANVAVVAVQRRRAWHATSASATIVQRARIAIRTSQSVVCTRTT